MIHFQRQNDQNFYDTGSGIENSKEGRRGNLFITSLLFFMVIILFAGCGSGGHSDMSSGIGSELLSGSFLDSAVEGLHYETGTQSGTTDMDGSFTYLKEEVIRFYIGNIMLGEAQARRYLTPVDLVPGAFGEMHPTVTNISRFLQTMDMDADPSNGIFIPESVVHEMQGRYIDFNMSPQAFEMDADVGMLIDTIGALESTYAGRIMVAAEVAQAHMRETLAGILDNGEIMNGGNAGNDSMHGGNVLNGEGIMNSGNESNGSGMM